VLWLDAGRQPAARQAEKAGPLANGWLVNAWYDGSGNALHLVQRNSAAQPRFVTASKHAVVRFDGKAHYLGATNLRRKLTDFTLFVVAAPRSNAGGFRGERRSDEVADPTRRGGIHCPTE
jgi:hypothetical protein